MKHFQRHLILGLILTLSLLLPGCWDQRELESLGLVQALGFDLGPDQKGVTITTMVAIPSKLGSSEGGGGEEPGIITISMDAPSIYEAFNLINTTLNREITLIQNQVLLIGEDLAKHGINKWVDNLIRFRQMRRSLLIFVCQGKAAEILQFQSKLEKNPAEHLRDLVMISRRNGMFPVTNLHSFMERYEAFAQQNYAPLVTTYQQDSGTKEESKKSPEKPAGESVPDAKSGSEKPAPPPEKKDIRIIGTAVFKADKVVGKLDLYETQILQLLTGEFNEAFLTITDPIAANNYIVFRLMENVPPTIKYRNKNGKNTFQVKLNLEADIVSLQSNINYAMPEKQTFLANQIAKALKQRINRFINKIQNQFNTDIVGFGIKVRSSMLTTEEWARYNWSSKFKEAVITTQVKVAIRRIGVQYSPPQERE